MVRIKLEGAAKVLEKIERTQDRITDYRDYFNNYAAPALFNRFGEIFHKQGAVENFSRWKRLRIATVLEKKRHGFRPEILRRTDKLYKAYTGRNSDNQITTTKNSLTYKNLVHYGIKHESGIGVVKRTVIARLLAYKQFRIDLVEGLEEHVGFDKQ